MTEWRVARGWSDAELNARLAQAADLERNFHLPEQPAPETGWNRHASEAVIARERPGVPEPDGAFVRAWALVETYAFSDPRIVRAHFDRDSPLPGRRMLLEIRVLGLHFLGAAVVAAAQAESDDRRTVRGFRYDTLGGHVERGCEWFLLEKDHASGTITFRIRAVWRPGDLPNWWSRLGFRLLARRYQRAWHRLAHLRLRAMIGARDLEPLPRGRRLVHEGPELPIAAVRAMASGRPVSEIAQERDEEAPPPGAIRER